MNMGCNITISQDMDGWTEIQIGLEGKNIFCKNDIARYIKTRDK